MTNKKKPEKTVLQNYQEQVLEGYTKNETTMQTKILKKIDAYKLGRAHSILWIAFDSYKTETHPEKYGKYLVCRKDDKIHFEIWNNSGWAYNHYNIKYWAEITPPQ